jgi:hypothetical protein
MNERSLSPLRRSLSNHKSRKDQNGSTKSLAKSISPVIQTRCSVCSEKISASNRASPFKSSTGNLKSFSNLGSNEEVKQLRRERDELKSLLDKFERHMSEIQANVKILTSERDKFNQLYEEAREELQRSRCHDLNRSCHNCHKGPNVSLAAQAILKRVESERDTALFDLRNAITDRESYREKLKVNTI